MWNFSAKIKSPKFVNNYDNDILGVLLLRGRVKRVYSRALLVALVTEKIWRALEVICQEIDSFRSSTEVQDILNAQDDEQQQPLSDDLNRHCDTQATNVQLSITVAQLCSGTTERISTTICLHLRGA